MELFQFKPEKEQYSTPVLFLHGMWHAAWCWEEFIPYFTEAGFTCYSFNLRNHGVERDPKGMRWIKIADYVKDLEEAVQQIGTNPVIIGHSMGGFIVQKYLEKSEPAATILLATNPHNGNLVATLRTFRKYPLTVLKSILTFNMIGMTTSKDRYRTMFLTEGTEVDSNYERIQNEAFRAYMDTVFFNLPRVGKIKKTLSKPDNLLVIAGENDTFFSPRTLEKTAFKYGGHFKVFEGLGHNVMSGPGSDKVAAYCIEFLKERM